MNPKTMIDLMQTGELGREQGTKAVRRLVDEQFEHVIDQMVGPDAQAGLNATHGRVPRC